MKTVLGSVSDTVLRHSRCPLAIIHYDTARTPHSAANPEREHRSGHDKSYRHRNHPQEPAMARLAHDNALLTATMTVTRAILASMMLR